MKGVAAGAPGAPVAESAPPAAEGIEARLAVARAGFSLEVSFRTPGRGVTGLFGPSGSGKTTLLRALAGLDRARGGFVSVNGTLWQDGARGLFLPTHRRALGYVFQEASLFPHLSVRGNLMYGFSRIAAPERRIAFGDAVEWLGLAPLLERDPLTLSGGERQRVAIGRALLASPRLLLMDEPLASLDAASKAEILPYLERLHRELSIPMLYVTHNQEEVTRLADHLLVLRQGRIAASGPMRDMSAWLDPLAPASGVGALLDAEVIGHDAAHDLVQVRCGEDVLVLPSAPLPLGHRLRLRVSPWDVGLARSREAESSTLNALPARVSALYTFGPGNVLVLLRAGPHPLSAVVPAKAVDAMALEPGAPVFAFLRRLSPYP